ncbi:5-oxoprolinase subunit PxpA [Microlunatus panaciterrae]|uniref:UPF0271 protein n=1 Tax=Microlunatus panaciterrae TaxID=400768 RepID=A0ABS2RL30_9ACTN|nr:UPF0271 protein [Microlunatus panaciterrae]
MAIDLNADLGESFGRWTLGDDEAMLDLITSANVACGFHAGDPATIRVTCREAVRRGVRIGAQVGYHDLVGFGRRFIDISLSDLSADILYQIGALDALARSVGGQVSYLKPHGALYNTVVDHEEQAYAVVTAVEAFGRDLPIVGLPGSALLRIAEDHQISTITEYFVDRNYTADGRLVDRRQPDALISDPDEASQRALQAAKEQRADSFCIHGDTVGSVAMAAAVRECLVAAGIEIRPFTSD